MVINNGTILGMKGECNDVGESGRLPEKYSLARTRIMPLTASARNAQGSGWLLVSSATVPNKPFCIG